MNVLLTAELRPLALAVNCLPVPAASISRLLNAAVPLPAAVPISAVVVPCKGPLPPLKAIATLRLAGRPEAERFPNAS